MLTIPLREIWQLGRGFSQLCLMAIIFVHALFHPFPLRTQPPAAWADTVSWSPDGQKIALSGSFGIRLFNSQLQTLPTQIDAGGVIADVAWSPDSTHLASAQLDGSVTIWDVSTGKSRISLQGHTAIVRSISWNPDGSRIATASNDGTVRIWDTRTDTTLYSLQHGVEVDAVGWSPDGSKLVSNTADSNLYIWDSNTRRLVLKTTGVGTDIPTIVWTADSAYILVGWTVFDAATGKSAGWTSPCSAGAATTAVTLSLDSSRIAYASANEVAAGMCIVDTDVMTPIKSIELGQNSVSLLAFSPSGDRILGDGGSGDLYLVDVASGQLISSTPPIFSTPIARSS